MSDSTDRLINMATDALKNAGETAGKRVFSDYKNLVLMLVRALEERVNADTEKRTNLWVDSWDGLDTYLPENSIIRFGDVRWNSYSAEFNNNAVTVRHSFDCLAVFPRVSNEVTVKAVDRSLLLK